MKAVTLYSVLSFIFKHIYISHYNIRYNFSGLHRFTPQAFYWDFNNRAHKLRMFVKKLSISFVFFNQLSVDMKDIENKLSEYTQNIWNEGLPAYPKLRTYITFKSNYKIEPYIDSKLTKCERSTFAQFRCRTLLVRIETGRFRNQRICDRLC